MKQFWSFAALALPAVAQFRLVRHIVSKKRGDVYDDILIGTGFLGTSLHTVVEKNDLTAGRDIEIGAQQDTTVIKNDFEAVGGITITGNPCTSEFNRPEVPCL